MLITRLALKNWRNFKSVDVPLRERVYVIGPNASGKSNLLDVLRFLRDIARPEGGGLQLAVKARGGMTRLRCLLARRDPEVEICIELADRPDQPARWRYTLAFGSEGKGAQRVLVTREKAEALDSGYVLLNRPDAADKKDAARLTQTSLEQVTANQSFREVAEFFAALTYLHLVPQLLKHTELAGGQIGGDPFGQSFLERIARTTPRTRDARLRKMESALRACVPNMRQLQFKRDEVTGRPHLEALYEHWRPDAGWQREDQFSDGTLRLLGIMWSLLDGDSLLLLEEPELSLNERIVRQIPGLIVDMQRKAKYRRQVFITTHSAAMLEHSSVDPLDVLRLDPTGDGSQVRLATEEERDLVRAGYTVNEALGPKGDPAPPAQLSIF
ncbi:AAA family ATPase [Derxia lacustris]|uniref:AAA family ATPase n=1 Tax=Derxia lacustris TaxID=764842 RepID=UPI000A171041|nr:ATP-binding protein [Derxia lacustris]